MQGKVLDTAREPAPEVRLRVISSAIRDRSLPMGLSWDRPTDVSAADGSYSLAAPMRMEGPVQAMLEIRAPGGGTPRQQSIELRAGHTTYVPDLLLEEPEESSVCAVVRVVTEAGEPIWGAVVSNHLRGRTSATWRTDQEGRVHVRTYPGERQRGPLDPKGSYAGLSEGPVDSRVTARAPGFAPTASEPIVPDPDDPPEVELVLGPGQRLSGQVVQADGTPARRTTVLIFVGGQPLELLLDGLRMDSRAPPTGAMYRRSRTDEDGRFALSDLEPPPYHVVAGTVALERYATAYVEDRGPVFLQLSGPAVSPCEVTGEVISAETGRPVPTFFVSAERIDEHGAVLARVNGINDRLGHFVLPDLQVGNWMLRIRADGHALHAEEYRVRCDDPPALLVRLHGGIRLRGRVLRSWDPADVMLWLASSDSREFHKIPLGAEGHFEITGLSPGRYYAFLAREDGVSSGSMTEVLRDSAVDLSPEEPDVFREFDVVEGCGLTLQYGELEKGQRYGAAEVPPEVRFQVEDARGEVVYEFARLPIGVPLMGLCLPAGAYTVRVFPPHGDSQVQQVALRPGSVEAVQFEVPEGAK